MMFRLVSAALMLGVCAGFAPSIQTRSSVGVAKQSMTARFATLSPPPKQEKKSLLENAELPDRLYVPKAKEIPKVLGGLKIGLRELVVITGASSGLGLNCAVSLAKTGKYFVVMACRDVEKAKRGT